MRNNNLIIVRIWEGLGNQLFQYAYARTLKEKGRDVRLDLDKAFGDVFVRPREYDIRQNSIQNFNIVIPAIDVEQYGKYQYIRCKNMIDKVVFALAKHGLWKYKYFEEVKRSYSPRAISIKGNYYVRGWFQQEEYFKQIRGKLLKELTPKKKIRISKELRAALESKGSVSVHIRRGDYVKIQHTSSLSFYKQAVTWMEDHVREPYFIIFSDDLDWVRKNFVVNSQCIYVNEDRRLQDFEELFIMSRCRHNIISNSTFSWWGAWLNSNPEKIVIAPKDCWLPRQKKMIYL